MSGISSPQPDLNRNRLPTLFEVLSRRTLPPVDLFSFYIYMRDQQRSVDYLDFWLDVAQHMSLCRHYVRELRRSVMIGTPKGDDAQSKRSSAALENIGDVTSAAGPSMFTTEKEKNQDAQMSAFLREQSDTGEVIAPQGHSPSHSLGSNVSGHNIGTMSSERPRPSFMSSPMDLTSDSNSPAHTVARADIRASAEKILYTFLLPGAEQRGRDDPEVFDAAKDYVFQAMERDAFPGFLRMKALGNLVPPSMMLRLIVGLLSMFAAFWVGFILIFLNYPTILLLLPFTIGVYALCSHQYALDPILALAGYSEYTFMSFSKIREPFVRRLLHKRALMVLMVTAITDAALVLIFALVPGKRL
ncbi:rgs domain protein [Botrytis cinerea]